MAISEANAQIARDRQSVKVVEKSRDQRPDPKLPLAVVDK
jgi:hypothetical protein